MTTEQMRQALLTAYSGQKWREKVKRMSDGQVFVVYNRLKNNNKL